MLGDDLLDKNRNIRNCSAVFTSTIASSSSSSASIVAILQTVHLYGNAPVWRLFDFCASNEESRNLCIISSSIRCSSNMDTIHIPRLSRECWYSCSTIDEKVKLEIWQWQHVTIRKWLGSSTSTIASSS